MFTTGHGCNYVVVTGVESIYFNFDKDEMTRMLGREMIHAEEFEIVQEGSRDWSGMINIQRPDTKDRPTYGTTDTTGRRAKSWDYGQWSIGDKIRLDAFQGEFIRYTS